MARNSAGRDDLKTTWIVVYSAVAAISAVLFFVMQPEADDCDCCNHNHDTEEEHNTQQHTPDNNKKQGCNHTTITASHECGSSSSPTSTSASRQTMTNNSVQVVKNNISSATSYCQVVCQGKTEARLKELNITLPPPSSPKGAYVSCVRSGNNSSETMLHLCGHIPTDVKTGELIVGKVGKELTVEQGYDAAKACALAIISTLQHELGGVGQLDRIKRIVKVVGFVNCTDDFTQQPAVINGASDLFGNVFGDPRGKHARSAVGTNSLPLNVATEVECIVELYP
jgi:enamine deaminase RidA (YjgF/YER057c/UK114 family)